MTTSNTVDNLEIHLQEKRNELIWALSLQDYTDAQIARIFNLKHRSTIKRIMEKKPKNYKTKWVKVV